MREALAGLTTRGRAFLAAGVTAIVCAVVLGQDDLSGSACCSSRCRWSRPSSSAAAATGCRWSAPCTPQRVAAGQPAPVELDLSNEGRTPTGLLLLEDQVPYVLGTRPRFVVDRIGRGWHRDGDLPGPLRRPRPLRDRPADGAAQRPVRPGRARPLVPHHGPLDRHPAHVAAPAVPLAGDWTGSGDNRPRAFAAGSAEDVTVREYRRGDDLRRVHWRSSARAGELMVRREEQPWQSRATLFLDNRRARPPRPGLASSLESAVVGRRLDRGPPRPARLHRPAGHRRRRGPATAWHDRDAELNTGPLLESLAVVQAARAGPARHRLARRAPQPRRPAGRRGRRARRDRDAPVFRRMQHHAGSALAVALDVDAVAPAAPRQRRRRRHVLSRQGWRAVTLGPRDRLDAVWQDLGRRSTQSRSPWRPRRPRGVADEVVADDTRRRAPRRHAPALAAARPPAPTWLALLSWRGFTEALRRVPGAAARARRCSSPSSAPCAAGGLRSPRLAGPARPAASLGAMVAGSLVAGTPVPVGAGWHRMGDGDQRRRDSAQTVRRAGAGRRAAASHPLLILGGFALPAARRPVRRHAAPGAAGRAAAADDLQRPGQHARAACRWWTSRSPRPGSC